jgi:hypothetical protein
MKPDTVIFNIIEGRYTLDMIDAIDTNHWSDDYVDVLITLRKLIKKEKSLTMENIYKEGGQIPFLNAMSAMTRVEHSQDNIRKQP